MKDNDEQILLKTEIIALHTFAERERHSVSTTKVQVML